jgi:hypothetical protein
MRDEGREYDAPTPSPTLVRADVMVVLAGAAAVCSDT